MPHKTCSAPDCTRKIVARELCSKHYQRLMANGHLSLKIAERIDFWPWLYRHLETETDSCVPWPFRQDGYGYGRVSINGKKMAASRLVCILVHGSPLNESSEAAHNCGKRICVNPKHLRWASRAENAQDRVKHGTVPRGESCSWSKLSEAQVLEVCDMLDSQETIASVARRLGVSHSCISDINKGRKWQWLTGRAA